jgi:hypothetical protein
VAALVKSTDREILVEGPAGTGKSHGILAYIHSLAWRYPKSRHLICRATRVSMTESILKTWEEQILGDSHPAYTGTAGRANRHSYDFPNDSTVVVGGLDNPEKLFSTEWDTVYVAEAIETSEDDWEKLGRAMRNNRMPYQQRVADTNPGPPNHWLNKRPKPIPELLRLVGTKAEYNQLQAYNREPSSGRMRRLVSKHQDNPAYWDINAWRWSPFGEQYVIGELSNMTGHRRARLFEGRWVAAEGTVFGMEFLEGRNIMDDFDPPGEWPLWVCSDPGFDHAFAVTFNTVSPNGTRYTVDEIYTRQQGVDEIAELIKAKLAGRVATKYYLDPRHGFMRTAQSPTTIAEQFQKAGIRCEPWPAVSGSALDASVNAHRKSLRAGTFKVCRRCVNTISEHQSWSYKRTSSGDLPVGDDSYEDKDNHTLDTLMGWERTNPQHIPQVLQLYQSPLGIHSGVRRDPVREMLELMREAGMTP